MIDLSQLLPESILGHLPLHDFQVEKTTMGHLVAERFEQEPNLSGVIVMDGATLIGMISRQRFLERMSRPFSREVYLKRPVQVLLSSIAIRPLRLPDTCRIDEAAAHALKRSGEAMYEPIVVAFRDGSLRLVDFRSLLLAQSHILTLVNRTVEQQKVETQAYLQKLKQEQMKVAESNRLLEVNQAQLQEQQRLLQKNQAELWQKSHELAQLNQRFIRIGQILSMEGKKAFQATVAGVEAVSCNTDRMIDLGKALVRDLEIVQTASNLIKRVSKQAQHLSLQATILTNQFGSEFEGVGRINSDIGQLSKQTFETGQRMDETAIRLKDRIGDLTSLAREGATAVQVLVEKVARAEVALTELEELVNRQDAATSSSEDQESDMNAMHNLMQRVERAGVMLSELEQFSQRINVTPLIEKIERRLKYSKRPAALR